MSETNNQTQARSRRRKKGRWQLSCAAASALTGLSQATLSRYLYDGKFEGEVETNKDGSKSEWYDEKFLTAWKAQGTRRTARPDPKHGAHAESSRMKRRRRQINAAAASALTGLAQAYLSQLLHEGKVKGDIEATSGGHDRAWYDEKFLKEWHEQRTLTLKTTDPELKEKLAERDLILYQDAQEYSKFSQTALDRLVAKGKLHKDKVTLVTTDGRQSPKSALFKSELESLFVPRPEPGKPICPQSGGRWYLPRDAKIYSGCPDHILLNVRKGKAEGYARAFYVIGSGTRKGRTKLRYAWNEKYLDKWNAGRMGKRPEMGHGKWARLNRAQARDDVKAFLLELKKAMPIRAEEGMKRAIAAGHLTWLIYDELRLDKGIEFRNIGREGWWCRPGQVPEQTTPGEGTKEGRAAASGNNNGQAGKTRKKRERDKHQAWKQMYALGPSRGGLSYEEVARRWNLKNPEDLTNREAVKQAIRRLRKAKTH
jgi:hypothetical protein